MNDKRERAMNKPATFKLHDIEKGGVIRNRQTTRRRIEKQKCYTLRPGYHYTPTSTNNVSKTWALSQTTGDKHHFHADTTITTQNSERKECSLFYNGNITLNF